MSELKPNLLQGETVLREDRAERYNRQLWSSSRKFLPGRLWLTDQRLIFKSGLGQYAYPLFAIANVRSEQTLSFVHHLRVEFGNGGLERFLIEDEPGWVKAIEEAKVEAPVFQEGEFKLPPRERGIPVSALVVIITLVSLVICFVLSICVLPFLLRVLPPS